jgi:hypothetical protein
MIKQVSASDMSSAISRRSVVQPTVHAPLCGRDAPGQPITFESFTAMMKITKIAAGAAEKQARRQGGHVAVYEKEVAAHLGGRQLVAGLRFETDRQDMAVDLDLTLNVQSMPYDIPSSPREVHKSSMNEPFKLTCISYQDLDTKVTSNTAGRRAFRLGTRASEARVSAMGVSLRKGIAAVGKLLQLD